MNYDVDKRFVTKEFLLKYFPDPFRFKHLKENPLSSSLGESLDKYLEWRNNINQSRQKSGKSILADCELVDIIKKSEGYVFILKPLDAEFKRAQ